MPMNNGYTNRRRQVVLVGTTLVASWLGMQAAHELGHVVAAVATGGTVARVVLDPRTISRTDLAENPNPLIVVWGGPLLGVALPLVLWGSALVARAPYAFLLRFFAGFCLVANGLYIGVGSFAGIGDCGEMLRHGSPPWQLWLFGAVALPIGIRMWNGEGTHFGFGSARGAVDRRATIVSVMTCLLLMALGFAFRE